MTARPTTAEETAELITGYVKDTFLDGDEKGELDARTPLLEWGVLNSLNTARLLAFIRERLGVRVPPTAVSPESFKNIDNITALVVSLGAGKDAR
ncbi:acyl carrier protein [Streptomyces sp. NPDC003006]